LILHFIAAHVVYVLTGAVFVRRHEPGIVVSQLCEFPLLTRNVVKLIFTRLIALKTLL